MKYYTYNAFLRFVGIIDHPDDCPGGCECTPDEPPSTPWPDGYWPFYLNDGWELVEVQPELTGYS